MKKHTTIIGHSLIVEATVLIYEYALGERNGNNDFLWFKSYESTIKKLNHIYSSKLVSDMAIEVLLLSSEREDVIRFREQVLNNLQVISEDHRSLVAELTEMAVLVANDDKLKAYFDDEVYDDCQIAIKEIETSLENRHPLSYAQAIMGKSFYNIRDYKRYEFCLSALRSGTLFRLMDDKANIMVIPLRVNTMVLKQREQSLVTLMKLLSDENRLKILRLVYSNPMNGKGLVEALGITKGTLSYHLEALKKAGLLHVERDGNNKYYSTNQKTYFDFVRGLNHYVTNTELLQRNTEIDDE